MNIIVCIKQVPSCNDIKINSQTNTIIRDRQCSCINPFDIHAIEEAIRIRDKFGGAVTAISMGPPSAKEVLKNAIAMGADHAVLLSDELFAGSDTLATAYTLSKGIEKTGNFDLVFCGKQSTDGDTAQVGPSLAAKLMIPHTTNVTSIEEINPRMVICKRITEYGYQLAELLLPALVSVSKGINNPRIAPLKGILKANRLEIPVWSANDIQCELALCGLEGSPTKVIRTFIPDFNNVRNEIISGSPQEQVTSLVEKVLKRYPQVFRSTIGT